MSLKDEIEDILRLNEDTDLEFKRQLSESSKFTKSEKKKLAKSVSAMANTIGGKIIVGYDKKTDTVVGINPEIIQNIQEYVDTIQRIVNGRCYPPIRFESKLCGCRGKNIIVLEVPRSQFIHHMKDTGVVYVRRGAIIDTAKPEEIAAKFTQVRGRELKLPKSPIEKWPFEDNRIFLFPDDKPVPFLRINKGEYFQHISQCVVFLPEFVLVAPPNLGEFGKSCYITYSSLRRKSIPSFAHLISKVENIWARLLGLILLDTYGPFYWGISEHEFITFGCGSENLIRAIKEIKFSDACFGAILQGCFGEHYDRTCFLVVSGDIRGGNVNHLKMDLYLSCVPTDWRWINKIYSPFKEIGEFSEINYYSMYDLPIVFFQPPKDMIEPEFLGGIRRLGFEDEERKYDIFSGLIVKTPNSDKLKYKIGEVNRGAKHLLDRMKEMRNPLNQFTKIVTSVTNSPPSLYDLQTGSLKRITVPSVKLTIFDAHGFTIYGLTIHSFPRAPETIFLKVY